MSRIIIPGINDGRLHEAGNPVMDSGDFTWKDVFQALTWDKPYHTARWFADKYGGMMLFDPFGRHLRETYRNPKGFVQLDTWDGLMDEIKADPDNQVLKKTMDVDLMVSEASLFTAEGFDLYIYLGGPDSYKRLPFQTSLQYSYDLESALMPYLSINPPVKCIYMDHWWGEQLPETKGFEMFRHRCMDNYSVPIGVEPGIFKSAVHLYDAPTLTVNRTDKRVNWSLKDSKGFLLPLLERELMADRIIWLNDRVSSAEKQQDINNTLAKGYKACVPMAQLEGLV